MRKEMFANGELYHVYNRGVDKRKIFMDIYDIERFIQSIDLFNSVEPLGSIYESNFLSSHRDKSRRSKKLVNIHCYCLNPNHFHFIFEQLVTNGISEFMHRLGGYVSYFNKKYKRTGALFSGRYKVKHINSNDYLLYLSAYVNLNDKVHSLGGRDAKSVRSSWKQYVEEENDSAYQRHQAVCCVTDLVLDQFDSKKEYKSYALSVLASAREVKQINKELNVLLLE